MHDVDGDSAESCCADADIIAARVCARHMSCQNTYSPRHRVLASRLISPEVQTLQKLSEQRSSCRENEDIRTFLSLSHQVVVE